MSHHVVKRGLAALLLAVWALPAGAQPGAGIQVALDKPVELKLSDVPIGQVFQRLTEQTGVRFIIGEDVYACLPYGNQTRLEVKLKNDTLRKALTPMLAQLAMDWIVEADAVRIVPKPALLRMNRRATYDELRVLGTIHTAEMKPTDKAGTILAQLQKACGSEGLKIVFHLKTDKDAAFQRTERALPCAAATWLDMLCHGQGWTWYLWGDSIMIVEKKAQVERQLSRQVSLRYQNAELVTVLLDLARQARVQLIMDPGVMDYLPSETRNNFNLAMSDATISQALEVISGATGLVFIPSAEGIRVEASERLIEKAKASAEPKTKRSPFFVRSSMTLADGSSVDLFIRGEDLPLDVQAAIEAERQKLIEQLVKKYGSTTRPATQPAP